MNMYVAPKPPKGTQKHKTAIFNKNRILLKQSLLQSFFVWKLSATKF